MEHNDIKYIQFWDEFTYLLEKIRGNPEDDKLIAEVEKIICGLGDFDWEYGPSDIAEYYFALSPHLNVDLLIEVDKIVSLAPYIKHWEVLSCKPRKKELLSSWRMSNEHNNEIIVDSNGWECIVYKFPDNIFELDIKIGHMDGNKDTQYNAIDIHLTNLLGERKYMNDIRSFDIVIDFQDDVKEKRIMLNKLFNYV